MEYPACPIVGSYSARRFSITPSKPDNRPQFSAACVALNNLAETLGPLARVELFLDEAGEYRMTNVSGVFDALYVPERVCIRGLGRGVTRIRRTDSQGQGFIWHYGSRCYVRDLSIDGARELQPENAGLYALQWAKPNGLTGGGLNIAGGMVLSAQANAGVSQLSVTRAQWTAATPGAGDVLLCAGDRIWLSEGAASEVVTVAKTYAITNPGSGLSSAPLVIPLTSPLLNTYTAAAVVSAFLTDSSVTDCEVLGGGRDGLSWWHAFGCEIRNNWIKDCSDTGVDFPSAGSQMCTVVDNDIETNGRWCVGLDTAETAYGRTSDIDVIANHCRMINGGVDALGTADTVGDCVYVGKVDRINIKANIFDMRRSGVRGVRLVGNDPAGTQPIRASRGVVIDGNIFRGRTAANTFAVQQTAVGAGTVDSRPVITNNTTDGFDVAIDLQDGLSGIVSGNDIANVLNYGVQATAHATQAQNFAITENRVAGCVVGVRLGGGPAGAIARVRDNVVTGFSFDREAHDPGWVVFQDKLPPQIADTAGLPTGAAPNAAGAAYLQADAASWVAAIGSAQNDIATLQTAVNALKAAMRTFGVLTP